jgi:enterochelin esterase-like enzyme
MSHSLIERAAREGNPVIDGDTATIIWQGDSAPHLISDINDMWEDKSLPFKPIAAGVWAITFDLPRDAYLEYAFYNPETKARFLDPLNPQKTHNGFNNYNNFFYMPEGAATPLVQRGEGVKAGKVTRYTVETEEYAVGHERSIYLYKPAAKGPVPLIVVYDGRDYLRQGRIAEMVDNLIAQKRIRPVALALAQNGGQARMVEYGCSEVTLNFVTEKVVKLAKKHVKLLDIESNPSAFGVIGASMGGLMSLYTGLRLPHIFGKVISQSGAFRLGEHEYVTSDLVRYGPKPDISIWMDVGKFESLLNCNRDMNRLLMGNGYRLHYREYSGGHNYIAWRDDLWRGLEELFG